MDYRSSKIEDVARLFATGINTDMKLKKTHKAEATDILDRR